MVLNKKINSKLQRGFTIVELLIVIVVIGILAAITIVAYSGITARANAARAQSNAESVQKVAEAYNADLAGYPTLAQLNAYTGIASVPTSVIVSATAVASVGGTTNIQYVPKGTTGGCVGWWNYGITTPVAYFTAVGNATVTGGGTACS